MSNSPLIAVLTSAEPRHDAFALAMLEAFGEERVVVVQEPKGHRPPVRPRSLLRRSRNTILEARNRLVAGRLSGHLRKLWQRKGAAESAAFGSASAEFRTRYADRVVAVTRPGTSINDGYIVDLLAHLEPEVLAVMGTGMLGEQIIAVPKTVALNLHTGLSPWYRGGFTNLWPLIRKEPQYCGATVHVLDRGVDAGPIAFHGVPMIHTGDDFGTINTRAIELGTALMVRAIRDALAGFLTTREQWVPGRRYDNVHLNAWAARRYHKNLEAGLLDGYARRLRNGQVEFPEGLLACRDEPLQPDLLGLGE